MRIESLVVSLAVGLLVAGCGASTATSRSAPTATTPTTSATAAVDTQMAKRAVLQLADLPAGFELLPPQTPLQRDEAAQRKLLECVHLSSAEQLPGRVTAHGATFVQRPAPTSVQEVGSGVVVESSEAEEARRFSALTDARTTPCFTDYLQSRFRSEPRIAKFDPHDLVFRPVALGAIGDQRAGFEGRVTLVDAGEPIDTTFDCYFARKGRAVAMVATVGLNASFPTSQAEPLLQKVVDRVDAA